MKNYQLPLLVFDEKCQLCCRFKLAVEKFLPPGKIYFENLHNPDLYHFFPQLSREECEKEVHFITTSQDILQGADAVSFIISQFPILKKFSWLIESKMGHKAVTSFYQVCNRYRESLLNRCHDCKK